MSKYILSIDQGTTSSRVCLFDKTGKLVDQEQKEFTQIFPKPGWVEHNPEEIWNSVIYCITEIFKRHDSADIFSVGITNQRETVVVWDKYTGIPVYNAIVWQCRRTSEICHSLKRDSRKIKKITGLVIDPYFSGTKIKWILNEVKEAKKGLKEKRVLAGTVDSYILWKLTAGKVHATDVTNASRTMLMDLRTRTWSKECAHILQIPLEILPEIKASNAFFGHIHCSELKGFFSKPLSIHGIAGDQQAALFGQACFKAGEAKCTFGTGSFILYNNGNKVSYSKKGLLTTVAWELEGMKPVYALEGGAFNCGSVVQWLKDNMQLLTTSQEIEELASSVSHSEGVEFVPALTGLGAPYWKEEATGVILGLTRKTSKAHLMRAALESLALQNVDIIKVMESETKTKLKILKTDGGAAKNNLLMQLQSDYLQSKVARSQIIETTALGVAYLAGIGSGFWTGTKEIENIWNLDREFKPQMQKKEFAERYRSWLKAIKLTVKNSK
ncbi:MAG: glycerol kinase GlpK [Bdellovibrionaceae bacterium]|nr:glycerol kinase GlpK [Pseudobdellovibrionaceae bacterium]NUM58551.1 glycerol kinase GlpK [Pseudobdellovibrionaceae bacterium]